MRIIAGRFKGHRLQGPRGRSTRPTADRVRESVFNLLATRTSLENAVVLDIFCGTGAFGLESISRGAVHVDFVDSSRDALKLAAQNAGALGVEERCRFQLRDGVRYLKKLQNQSYDLVFADPPYTFEMLASIPRLALGSLRSNGLLVLEHDKRHRFEDDPFRIESRSYGRTIVTIFQTSTASTENQAEAT